MESARVRDLGAFSAQEMAAVDHAMFDSCGLDILQVMETAGRAIAVAVRNHFGADGVAGCKVAVLAGTGGNGGDALVTARYLHGWKAKPEVWLGSECREGSAAQHQLDVARSVGVAVHRVEDEPDFSGCDLIVDGLFGFGLDGPPRGRAAELIDLANRSGIPTLTIDVPSGLEATDGTVMEPCIVASTTVTLAAPKTGLLTDSASRVVGDVLVADIGIPDAAYRAAKVEPPRHCWTNDFVKLVL